MNHKQLGSMVIVPAERIDRIRGHVNGLMNTWDERPSQAEMISIIKELIERRAQMDAWPDDQYVTVREGELHKQLMALRRDMATTPAESDRQNETICELNNRLSNKDGVIAELAVERDAAREQLAIVRDELEAVNLDKSQLEQDYAALRQKLDEANASIDTLHTANLAAANHSGEQADRIKRIIAQKKKDKTKAKELEEELRKELYNMTDSNRHHVIALKRLQGRMNALSAMIASEVTDYFAGFGSPGEPESPEVMQAQLQQRIDNIIDQKDILS